MLIGFLFPLFFVFEYIRSYDCWGFSTGSPYACSGHGSCVADDTCSCDSGYVGTKCSFEGCYDVLSDSDSVCGGHGTCSYGVCECDYGWKGEECGNYTCNGYYPDQDGVCTSRGACTGPNLCECETYTDGSETKYYYGLNCEFFDCDEDDHMCKSIVSADRVTSTSFQLVDTGYNPSVTFDYTLYTLFPYRRPSDEIDCVNVFDSESYQLVGDDAECSWSSSNSHEFVVYLGSLHHVDEDTTLKVNLFPFELNHLSRTFYVELDADLVENPNIFVQVWNAVMEVLPSWIKSIIYQVLGFVISYWYFLLIGGFIFCVIFGTSTFTTCCCCCCDPIKIKRKIQERKYKKLKKNAERLRDLRQRANAKRQQKMVIRREVREEAGSFGEQLGGFDGDQFHFENDEDDDEIEMNEFGENELKNAW